MTFFPQSCSVLLLFFIFHFFANAHPRLTDKVPDKNIMKVNSSRVMFYLFPFPFSFFPCQIFDNGRYDRSSLIFVGRWYCMCRRVFCFFFVITRCSRSTLSAKRAAPYGETLISPHLPLIQFTCVQNTVAKKKRKRKKRIKYA